MLQHRESARWLIVEDNELACRALHRLIGVDQPATIAQTGHAARVALRSGGRWIGLFVDLNLGDDNGVEILSYARQHDVLAPATLVTGEEPHRALLNRTFALGAGFLCKPVSPGCIIGFVARCLARQHALPSGTGAVLERMARERGLSRREVELLVRVVAGATIDGAQQAMGISKSTRKTHTASLLQKVAAKDLKEVTIAVLRAALASELAPSPQPYDSHGAHQPRTSMR